MSYKIIEREEIKRKSWSTSIILHIESNNEGKDNDIVDIIMKIVRRYRDTHIINKDIEVSDYYRKYRGYKELLEYYVF